MFPAAKNQIRGVLNTVNMLPSLLKAAPEMGHGKSIQ